MTSWSSSVGLTAEPQCLTTWGVDGQRSSPNRTERSGGFQEGTSCDGNHTSIGLDLDVRPQSTVWAAAHRGGHAQVALTVKPSAGRCWLLPPVHPPECDDALSLFQLEAEQSPAG
jgi:hypothetical protein